MPTMSLRWFYWEIDEIPKCEISVASPPLQAWASAVRTIFPKEQDYHARIRTHGLGVFIDSAPVVNTAGTNARAVGLWTLKCYPPAK